MIKEINDDYTKQVVCRQILESLPESFGIVSAREEYIENIKNQQVWYASSDNQGIIAIRETSKYAIEIVLIAIKWEYQHSQLGSKLIQQVVDYSQAKGYKYIHVKTIAEGHYQVYDIANKFYQKCGFEQLEVITDLWSANHPCQIYIKQI